MLNRGLTDARSCGLGYVLVKPSPSISYLCGLTDARICGLENASCPISVRTGADSTPTSYSRMSVWAPVVSTPQYCSVPASLTLKLKSRTLEPHLHSVPKGKRSLFLFSAPAPRKRPGTGNCVCFFVLCKRHRFNKVPGAHRGPGDSGLCHGLNLKFKFKA